MDSQFIPPKSKSISNIMLWILIATSILSCSCRADYNIIIGFLLLMLRSHRTEKYKQFAKVIIHIIILSLLFDLIWIWQYTSYWKHGEETSELWQSLSFVHSLVYYLGICEFLLKIPIILFLYQHFIKLGCTIKDLLNLKYSPNIL